MGKIKLILCIILCSVVLSGCTWVLAEPDKLISPPVNNSAEFQDRKLISSLLAEDEHLTVPDKMDNHSPSVNIDINGDGTKEKMIFWVKNNGFQSGVTILKEKSDGSWSVYDQKRLSGKAINYFKVKDMNGDGISEIFLGVDSGGFNTLYIYHSTEEGLQLVDQLNYTKLSMAEIDSNSTLLICALANTTLKVSSTDINVYQWKNNGIVREYHQIFSGYCQEMDYGKIDSKNKGLVLVLSTEDRVVNVKLLTFDTSQMKNLFDQEIMYINALAAKNGGIIQDINQDGIIDILTIIPPLDASNREPKEFLQVWRNWNGKDGLKPVLAFLENKTDGYKLSLPTNWLVELRYMYLAKNDSSQITFFDGKSDSERKAVFTIFTKEINEKTNLNKLKNNYNVLGISPTNQKIYLMKLYKGNFSSEKIEVQTLKRMFKSEGG